MASRCFDITARALAELYYCPDHVRCWSRKAYFDAGGHNPDLFVADDHELMIKTYLKGYEFAHIGGCGYLYRIHSTNTVKERNQEIQKLVAANRVKYTAALIREEARRKHWPVIDMTGLWEDGWRFERDLKDGFGSTNSIGLIICRDLLQWCEPGKVATFMNEVYDALVPGGYLEIRVPTSESNAGLLDPDYRSHFNAQSFHVYTRTSLAKQNPNIRCRFQFIQSYQDYPSPFHQKHNFRYAVIHLAALKGQRQAGLEHI